MSFQNKSYEVLVGSIFMTRRWVLAAALVSGVAAAQPYDDCAAALAVVSVAASTVTSATIDISGYALGTESPISCRTTASRSIWYSFVAPASGSYTIASCGQSNFDTVLQVYSGPCAAPVALTSGCNDDGCAPQSTVTVTLTAGTTYRVQVAGWSSDGSDTGNAGISITAPAPPPPPPSNDLCAAAETLTLNGTTPVLSTVARSFSASAPPEGDFVCITTPTNVNHTVWYQVTPTVSGVYRFESCVAAAPGNQVSDTVLALYTGTCGALVPAAASCGDDTCGSQSAVLATLTAGATYYLQLGKFGGTAPTVTADALQLSARQLFLGEADLCSATSPTIDVNRVVTVSTTSPDAGFTAALNNATLAAAASTCFSGVGQTSSTGSGRDVAYRFVPPAAGNYSFRLGAPASSTVNALLYLTDTCVQVAAEAAATYTSLQCRAAANRTSASADSQEQISCVPLSPSTPVYVWIDETSVSTAGTTYTLEVSDCVAESEAPSNDTIATAQSLSSVTTGSIGTTSDVDVFALGAPPVGSRVFAMAEGAAASSADFAMRLTNAAATLEFDEDGLSAAFGATAPVIAGTVSDGGALYLRVNRTAGTSNEPYVLYSTIQTGTATAEIEPNATFAAASTAASNYFTGEITALTDVDTYAFTATVGDLVFAALDPELDKTTAPPTASNFALALVDSTDTVLISADETVNTVTVSPVGTSPTTGTTPIFPAEALVYRIRATGSYGVRVTKTLGTTSKPYLLSVSAGARDVAPTISAVSPANGLPAGGLTVTVTGTNFSERTVVRFGNGIASVTSISPTQLIVSTPPGAGLVPVVVTNGIGPSLSASLPNAFEYEDPPGIPPSLVSLTPSVGPVTGGTLITLTGTVFRRDAGVFFDVGGTIVPSPLVVFDSTTRLTVTTPPHAEGLADVRVINFDGLSSQLDAGFAFQGPPTVTTVTPNSGLTDGGLLITVAGTNLRAGTTVRVGGTLASAVTPAANGLSLTALTPPAAAPGVVDVLVRTSDGQNAVAVPTFTYSHRAPAITAVTPNAGFASGGRAITITGSAFLPNPTVTVGGAPATTINRTSFTQITALTPPGLGVADVVVINSDTQRATAVGAYRYVSAPTVTAITPVSGPAQGGTRITITGTDFVAGATVSIGGVAAFSVNVTSPTSLTALTNAGPAVGAVDVMVTNPDTQSGTLPAAFTYDGAPTLATLAPISGTIAGGTPVTLTGTHFRPNARVFFGTTEATLVTVDSPTSVTAVTPARAVGVVAVTLRNADNQFAELQSAYRFVTPPGLTAVAPMAGDVGGGTLVRLTGSGFTTTSTVSFGGTAVAELTFVSATELDAVSPAHAPGAVDVVVTTEGASATLAGGFTYTRGAPTLAVVAPLSGPITGGSLLTLTGTGFSPTAAVTVGGLAATDVVVVSSVLARAVAPAHAEGAVEVVVTNDDAQTATLASAFTYVAPLPDDVGAVTDGGTGSIGEDPTRPVDGGGGISCGCTSVDGSLLSFLGLGLLLVMGRRRRG